MNARILIFPGVHMAVGKAQIKPLCRAVHMSHPETWDKGQPELVHFSNAEPPSSLNGQADGNAGG